MREIIPPPKKPFLLFSLGFEGFEGEWKHWDVPKENINVYNILVRIKHEMECLKKRTGRDCRPFGTYKPFGKPREKLLENYNHAPIDFFFTINSKDLAEMDDKRVRLPCTSDLRPCDNGWRSMVDVDTRKSTPIPEEICTFGGAERRPYYGLVISNLEIFPPKQECRLKGEHLFWYLKELPVKSWNMFAWGTLYADPDRRAKHLSDRRILATAQLVYPYVYEIRKR